MKKSVICLLALSLTGCFSGTARIPPQEFTANFGGVPIGEIAQFSSFQGGSDRKVLNACGTNQFSNQVRVRLEDAPVGISLVSPNPNQVPIINCASLAPVQQNFILGVAHNAPIGEYTFQVVVSSEFSSQQLPVSIRVDVSPIMIP